jgi:hypothetical protein
MYYAGRIIAVAALLGLLAAAWFSVRLAQADAAFREQSFDSVERATQLMPRSAEYMAFHALQLEYDGRDSTGVLEHIAAQNPFASAPRIRLGLAAESRGDFAAAEKWLLDAARVDQQFEPRWTLANFYFRRNRADPFWKWMRLALEHSYGDRAPAFDLCWRMSNDPAEIAARAIAEQHDVLASYAWYLVTTHRAAAAAPVALKLAAMRDPSDQTLLWTATDALIDARETGAAVALWKALGNPENTEHGFDWRAIQSAGVTHIAPDASINRRIILSGRQPEQCDLLFRYVLTKPGRRYLVHWTSQTRELPKESGVEWRVEGQASPVHSSDDWQSGQMPFTAASDLAKLQLAYKRPAGQARAEGSIELRDVHVTEIPQ